MSSSNLLATDYYVSDSSGDDGNAGTEAEPFKTISTALIQASASDIIFVEDGTYLLTDELVMDKALTLRSINGYDDVEIQQTVADKRVISMTADGAILSGVTVKSSRHSSGTVFGQGISVTAAAAVTNCVVTGATGGGQNKSVYGGGIYMSAAGLISDCIISNNVVSGWGAGVAITAGTMEHCLITENQSGDRYGGGAGAGVYIYGSSAIVQNCLIVDNTATYYNGAGVWLKSGILQNCTIVDNEGPASGAGLFQTGGTALNLIIYGNSPNDICLEGGTITYSCASGLMTGEGNTFMPPSFVDSVNGDYRLSVASPCIDTGSDAVSLSYDYVFYSRPVDGDGDGTSTIDMGCYEYQIPTTGLWCRFDVSSAFGTNNLDTTFNATAKRDGTPVSGESYSWNFGDTLSGSGQNPSHSYSVPGDYTVELTVTDGFGSETLTRTGLVKVTTLDSYVSTNGAGIFPYDSWENAATNIQDAIVAASLAAQVSELTSTIHLTNEVYDLNGQLVLDTGIAVEGANRDSTILNQNITIDRCVKMTHDNSVLRNLTVTGGNYNTASTIPATKGLGVYMAAAGLITNCVVESSSGGGQNYVVLGGGVYMSDGLVVDSILRNNTGGITGNGIYMTGGLANRCVITENSGGAHYRSSGGIGAYLYGAATLQNSLIVSNTSSYMAGGGVKIAHPNAVVQNCTIVDNTSGTEAGAGIDMTSGTLCNTILYGNTTGGTASDLSQSGGTVTYSCLPDVVEGEGNIINSPAFADYSNGDFKLTSSSPCVDTGINLPTVTTDLDHVVRPVDGNLSGTAITDMGCHEFTISLDGLLCSFEIVGSASGLDTASIEFTSSVLKDGLPPDTNSVNYAWDFGDGETAEGLGLYNPTHTYLSKGVFDVSLEVTFEGDTASLSREDYVKVYGETVYVTMPGIGSHIFPYDTIEKAATNMASARIAAVGAADNGATLVDMIVYDGYYYLDSELLLDKPINLRSVNGPDVTTLQPSGVTRVVNIISSNVTLSGFTIANGSGSSGAGVYMTADAMVTNCIITANQCGGHGNAQYGGGIWMSDGLAVDSVISNNGGPDDYYYMGSAVYMMGGTLDRCTITNNHGGSQWHSGPGGGICMNNAQATVRNCLIANNRTSWQRGGGVYVAYGTIENCTIVDNESNSADAGGEEGGGIWLNTSSAIARNLIVYGNRTAGESNDVYIADGSITYSCAPELTTGDGNITGIPSFKDFDNGDYHITGGVTFNTGTNLVWIVDTSLDLDRELRLQGKIVDMGCYEWQYPRGSVILIQ